MAESRSRHFDLHELIDYIRQTGGAGQLAAIRFHLEVESCERCRRNAELLESAYGAARELSRIDVPEAVEARARSIFEARPVVEEEAWWKRLPALALELAAGGTLEPAPAGYRSTATQRQRVYRAGSLLLRVLVDRDPEGARTLVGALGDTREPGKAFSGLTVLVTAGDKTLTQARTSRFGEFHLELPDRRNMSLVVLVDGEKQRLEVAIED